MTEPDPTDAASSLVERSDEGAESKRGVVGDPSSLVERSDEGAESKRAGAHDPTCTFCRIVAGELPAFVAYEDEHVVAFLDVRPLFPGHTLVVPRSHVVTLAELPTADVGPFFERVQAISAAIPAALGAQGTFVANNNTVSQSVPHLHLHVVPRTKGDGLRGFFWPRTTYRDDAHAAEVAAAIRSVVSPPG